MTESEFWNGVGEVVESVKTETTDCDNFCPVHCGIESPAIGCGERLRHAHATTQPPWIDLLSAANCPPCGQGNNGCYMTEKNRECWASYLKKKYDWDPVEVPK